MRPNLKFRRGEFITQNSCPDSFAIFGGDAYDPVESGGGVDYSLICYYNPNHYTQNSENRWVREQVFEYDLDDDETCEYTINANDMDYWRSCSQTEIDSALKLLATKRLAWLESTNKFRKLGVNEVIKFDDNDKSPNVCRTAPMYRGSTPGVVNPNARGSALNRRKEITRTINDNWEQKEPITCMDYERSIFIIKQCEKLKHAFDTYSFDGVRVYPNNGTQIPRRMSGYPDVMGHGMRAYDELMNGDDWGYYDCE